MMPDVETLLRNGDPARAFEVPGPTSEVGRHIRAQIPHQDEGPRVVGDPTRTRRGARRLPLAAAAAVVAIVTALIATLLPGPVGPQPSQAAVLLSHLASQAGEQGTALRAGQYDYTEISTQTWTGPISFEHPQPRTQHEEYLEGTVQTWVAADGSGRRVDTTDPTPRFYSASDHTAWVKAGEPPSGVPPVQMRTVQRIGPDGATTVGLPIPLYTGPIPLFDVSWLPTDRTALSRVLGEKGISRRYDDSQGGGWPDQGVGFDTSCSSAGCRRFVRAVALLQGPDIGETPALRRALYQVMSEVPGVKVIGPTTDRAGQSGIGLELVAQRTRARTGEILCPAEHSSPSGAPGRPSFARAHFPATSTTLDVIVDTRTTTVLSSETEVSPLYPTIRAPARCGGFATVDLPTWLMVMKTGVVNSDTAVP